MLIGVDVDPGESLERISSWAEGNGFFWQLAPVSAQPLKDYRISQQSAAVGIDASGEIVLRKNGGLQGEDKWRDWLTTLSGRTASAQPEAPSTAASVPVAPAPAEAVPTAAPAPAISTAAPVTQPVQPEPTVAAAPTAAPRHSRLRRRLSLRHRFPRRRLALGPPLLPGQRQRRHPDHSCPWDQM